MKTRTLLGLASALAYMPSGYSGHAERPTGGTPGARKRRKIHKAAKIARRKNRR